MEKGALKSCGYYERGGMSGGKYIARVALNRDGKVIFDLEKTGLAQSPRCRKAYRDFSRKVCRISKNA